MQYDARHSQPPSPVEPEGFFTGVEIRPLILGVVMDHIATYAMMFAYYFAYVVPKFGGNGEIDPDKVSQFMLTAEGLTAGMVIGALGTMIGGMVAGYKAGGYEAKHGGLVGAGSLLVAFIQQSLAQETLPVPDWYRTLGVILAMPVGAIGGYIASFLKYNRYLRGDGA